MAAFFAAPLRVLVPVLDHVDLRGLVQVAAGIGGSTAEIVALDVVDVPAERDLSTGATAARLARVRLEEVTRALPVAVHPLVRIDRSIQDGVHAAAADLGSNLILVGRSGRGRGAVDVVDRILRRLADDPTSHVAMLRSGPRDRPKRILVAVRGGPHAEFALATAGVMAAAWDVPVSVLHVMPPGLTRDARLASERSLRAMADAHVASRFGRVVCEASDVVAAIRDETGPDDLLVLGASLRSDVETTEASPVGDVPARLLAEAQGSVMVVRTREHVPPAAFEELAARPGTLPAIDRVAAEMRGLPARVDRWFAESNYHHAEFSDLRRLVQLKEKQNLTVSLVLPTLNEEETIGPIVRRARAELVERLPFVDEILVIDSASTDRTREIAEAEGARVVQHPDVLTRYGSFRGKGEALWKSLYETSGDIIAWADTDVRDWHQRMVYGTVGPLLVEPRIRYAKGYYQRPIVEGGVLKEGGGGRVTELVARPLINLLYPELSGFIQPLAGEYAGRRSLLETIPFFTGYAVEIGHLIDTYERVGLEGLGQVDLERRIHRNQELEGLSKMAFAILQAVLRRLETGRRARLFAELGSRMKLPRSGAGDLFLEVIDLGDAERPPMRDIPEYRDRLRAPEGGPATFARDRGTLADGLAQVASGPPR